MTTIPTLPSIALEDQTGFRLINSKFPPISLFEDVADEAEFDALYELQALTNPRIRTEVGQLNLLRREEIPFGIRGCSYAIAPFTHVNPDGSRFSNGQYGVLYLADCIDTAIREVAYHQEQYWQKVPDLKYDRFLFRGLRARFTDQPIRNAQALPASHPVYHSQDYSAARQLGLALRKSGTSGIQYHSVRQPGATCWGLFSPRGVSSIVQTAHYEFIWDSAAIRSISRVVHCDSSSEAQTTI